MNGLKSLTTQKVLQKWQSESVFSNSGSDFIKNPENQQIKIGLKKDCIFLVFAASFQIKKHKQTI